MTTLPSAGREQEGDEASPEADAIKSATTPQMLDMNRNKFDSLPKIFRTISALQTETAPNAAESLLIHPRC